MAETDLERWAAHRQFPIIPCTLCGSQDNLQRVQTKQMLRDWERRFPGRIDNLFNAMGKVTPSHLMDRNLYPFETLQTTGVPQPGGDRAFDPDGGDPDEACGELPVVTLARPSRGTRRDPFTSSDRPSDRLQETP